MPDAQWFIGEYPAKRNPRMINLTGQRFGRLLVIGFAGIRNTRACWHALCDCGKGGTFYALNLRHGRSLSCGCLRSERSREALTTHGEAPCGAATAEYKIYRSLTHRCNNPSNKAFHNYGQRGITCSLTYPEFLAEVGRRPAPEYSIERIDNERGYEKGNLRWATKSEQARNRRTSRLITLGSKTQCMAAWAEELDIPSARIFGRLKLGWCDECTLSTMRYAHCPHKSTVSSALSSSAV